MAYVYKDIDGKEHELYDSIKVEEIIDVTSGEVLGYRAKSRLTEDKISKETYDAIKKLGNR